VCSAQQYLFKLDEGCALGIKSYYAQACACLIDSPNTTKDMRRWSKVADSNLRSKILLDSLRTATRIEDGGR
jgi:hypothetical protein